MNKSVKIIIIIVLSALAACTSSKEKLSKSIYNLETSDSSSTPKGMNDLAEMYFDYGNKFTKDSIAESYLFKGFMFKYILKKWDDAIKFSNFYKQNYPISENWHSINLKLANVYNEGKNNLDSAVSYYIKAKGKARFSTDDYRMASLSLHKWTKLNLNSQKRADILYQAAFFSQTALDYDTAVKLYSEVATKYPDYKKSPDALSAAGFICCNDLKKTEQGKTYYKQLIEKYPYDSLTKDARIIINENIFEMSDLELSEYLTKKKSENKAK